MNQIFSRSPIACALRQMLEVRQTAAWVVAATVLASGCKKPEPPPAEPTVASVDGHPITVKAFQAEVQRRAQTGADVDPVKLLEDLVRREVLVARAEKEGFANRPEVRDALRHLLASRYFDDRSAALPPLPPLEEGEVRQRYQDELQRHVRPEAVSVAVLRLEWHPKATEEKKAESLAAANQLRARAQQQALPGGFGALAEAHSTHQSTRYKGGELGWQTRAQLDALLGDPALVNAALALQQPGEISQPLPGRDGLHLFKLIGRRFAQSVPFEERRAAIQHQLSIERQREREARVVREAQQGLAVTMNRELAATFKPVKTNTIVPPPAMPKP